MASVVVTENPKLSRILKVKRKLRIQPLIQTSQRVHKCTQKVGLEPGPGSTVDKERTRERGRTAFKTGEKLLLASDDPRRGGRIGGPDRREERVNRSSMAQKQISEDHRKNDSQSPNDGEAAVKCETSANIYKDTSASVIITPQAKWEDELSSPAFRQVPRSADENTHGKGGPTRRKDIKNRIPW